MKVNLQCCSRIRKFLKVSKILLNFVFEEMFFAQSHRAFSSNCILHASIFKRCHKYLRCSFRKYQKLVGDFVNCFFLKQLLSAIAPLSWSLSDFRPFLPSSWYTRARLNLLGLSKNIRGLSWMSPNVSFCSFL